MENLNGLNLQTREGCKRWLAILIAIVLVLSCIAQLLSSDNNRIKVENVTFDVRGAEINGDLYYPAGATDEDKYPAVILAPGAGVVKENLRGLAEELAHRSYVVLNVNPYGNGLSETPVYNENDMGPDQFNIFGTPLGVLDAIDFVRTMEFVDHTRIGLSGHSQGSRRTGYAALMDCGYYTFNDVLLILLHDTFGLEISEADISGDADAIAAERLTPEFLAVYQQLKEKYAEDYECMARSLCLLGSTAQYCNPVQTVDVAGHEVTRTCKINMAIINGTYDFSYVGFNNGADTKAAWYIPETEDIVDEGYYALDDLTGTSKLIGQFRKDTILNNEELAKAIADRSLRIVMQSPVTHSAEFFTRKTFAKVVDYFNQTLNQNADSGPTPDSGITFHWRELMNLLATFAMLGMLIPLISLFLLDKRYAGIRGEATTDDKSDKPWVIWLVTLLSIGAGFLALYLASGGKKIFNFSANLTYPLMLTCWTTVHLTIWLAVLALVPMAVYVVCTAKYKHFLTFLKNQFTIGVKNILRSILVGVAFVGVAYLLLEIIEYLFQQDFRWFMTAYTMLKANHWWYVLTYGILLLPFFLIISLGVNYVSDRTLKGRKPWLDLLITILVNSVGLWLCWLLSTVFLHTGVTKGYAFCNFILTYGALLTAPINVFILRASYQKTRTIWTGAVICSLMVAWLLVSTSGMNGMYIPQSWYSIFLGR